MITDPIADFLTRIRNGYMGGLSEVHSPHSKMRESIAGILRKEGYIESFSVVDISDSHKELVLKLSYNEQAGQIGGPKVKRIHRLSRPGQRLYVTHQSIPSPLRGMGTVILSTSHGVITGKEARKRGLGGEIICEVW